MNIKLFWHWNDYGEIHKSKNKIPFFGMGLEEGER